MPKNNRLYLQEEILLLALEDRSGTTEMGSQYGHAMAGAILAELLLEERIALDESRRTALVQLLSDSPVGDPVIDDALGRIASAKRRASLQTWVSRLANSRRIKHEVAGGLCRRGVLRADEDKVLFLFTRKIYPEINPKPERELTERLRRAIYTEATDIDPRTVVLVSLAQSSDMLKSLFPKKELRQRRSRIEQVINGEATGKATAQAIQAAQAAAMVATMIPVMTVTTMSH
jgi:hypothetical protein